MPDRAVIRADDGMKPVHRHAVAISAVRIRHPQLWKERKMGNECTMTEDEWAEMLYYEGLEG
jgi:hypothetical protein